MSIINHVGNTPLIKLFSFKAYTTSEIYAKLEYFNPTGSIKDRVAKKIIDEAEKTGELDHNKTILEATSGNMGISLAMIGAIKGYNVTLTMQENKSTERAILMKMLGATLILTDKNDPDSNIKEALNICKTSPDNYYFSDQNNNPNNTLVHYQETASEIIQQMGNSAADYIIAGIGTGGTISGLSLKMKEINPNIRIIGVQPASKLHNIDGIKDMRFGYRPKNYKDELVDETIFVPDENAIAMTKYLATHEGLLVGISSGATAYAALKIAEREKRKLSMVIIFADTGLKYLSKNLF